MNLYIVRHTFAESGSPDSERKLTSSGREKLFKTFPYWELYIPQIDIILSSPYKRALETAELIHKNYDIKEKVIVDNSLQPGMNTSDLLITLSAFSKDNIMIVGHLPDVVNLVYDLVPSFTFDYPFEPGTLASIEFKGEIKIGCGKLNRLIPLRK